MKKPTSAPPKSEIDVYLRPNDEVYAKYYPSDDIHLCLGLVEYLNTYTIDLELKDSFVINVYCGTGQDPILFANALKNTFTDKIYDSEVLLRRNGLVAIISMMVGLIFGLSAFFLTDTSLLLTSFLAIVSWVFIWYAVEAYSFDSKQMQLKVVRFRQLQTAEVRSFTLTKEEENIQSKHAYTT